jgi:hypothetical protein
MFQPMTQTPGKFYEDVHNEENESEFQGIKLEIGKVHKISEQDLFQKLGNTNDN